MIISANISSFLHKIYTLRKPYIYFNIQKRKYTAHNPRTQRILDCGRLADGLMLDKGWPHETPQPYLRPPASSRGPEFLLLRTDVLTLTAATPTALPSRHRTPVLAACYLLGGSLADRTPAWRTPGLAAGEAAGAPGAADLRRLLPPPPPPAWAHIGAALCCAFRNLMAGGITLLLRRYVTTLHLLQPELLTEKPGVARQGLL